MLDMNELINKIHHADFSTFSSKIPDQTIDLIVTSPPFGIGKEYEKKQSLEKYLEWTSSIIGECKRILKENGSIFWHIGTFIGKNRTHYPLDILVFPYFIRENLIPRNRIIWIRQHGTHAKTKFSNRYETILWFTKSDNYKFYLDSIRVPQKYPNKKGYRKGKNYGKFTSDPRGKNPGDVWAFRNVKHNHEEQTEHPCQFPEDMIARIIIATTDRGDIVLDPFIGSGTTAVVAKNYKRNFIGCEIVENYVTIANQRLIGNPDDTNCFPNLKTLRQYIYKTGEKTDKYSFSRQIGKSPTPSNRAKIFPERHHLTKTIERLMFEAENSIFKRKDKN